MSWTSDPELQQMFVTELEERSQRLLEGARAMQAGTVDDEMAGVMLREGHTIKGTSRVMGFEALSRAGQLIEQLWRRIQHGDTEGSIQLGEALEAMALAVPEAVVADPTAGTTVLITAINQLNAATGEPALPVPAAPPAAEPLVAIAEESPEPVSLPEPEPEPEPEAEPELESIRAVTAEPDTAQAGDGDAADTADVVPLRPDIEVPVPRPPFGDAAAGIELGGLLGALESWAIEQTMIVNAGRLYRLINRIADVRNELASLQGLVGTDTPATDATKDLSTTIADLQHDALALAAIPLSGMTNSLPQLVRYLAKKLDRDVRFEIVGDDDIAVDRQVIDVISDPVRQLIVNAIRHGIEPALVRKKLGKPATGSVSVTTALKESPPRDRYHRRWRRHRLGDRTRRGHQGRSVRADSGRRRPQAEGSAVLRRF